MDLRVPKRLPKPKLTATERYLGVPSHAPLTTATPFAADELHEDDVVFFGAEFCTEHKFNYNHNNNNHSSTTSPSSSSSIPNHHHHHHHHHHRKAHAFSGPDSFGILAALPENTNSANNLRNPPQLFHNHKASVSSTASSLSSSSSSSSASFSSVRAISAIPRPPHHHHDRFFSSSSSFSSFNRPMSVPVDMPTMSEAARRTRHETEADDVYDCEEDGERLPPHEIMARREAGTPVVSCSVLEGAGRTLKGRDLRRVRNAVWRQTGFID